MIRLRATWHRWEAHPRSPLQSAIWEAVCHLPSDLDAITQAILLLTYFEAPRRKQSEVIQALALGRSTYYRYLDRAAEALGEKLVQLLRPALRLELPSARQLVGRDVQFAQAQFALQNGKIVHLLGGGGVGKTSLGAQLAANWRGGVYLVHLSHRSDRPSGSAPLLACLLPAPTRCVRPVAHLSTNPQEISVGKVLAALRQHLAELSASPPLLCFDEVDLLLASDLSDSQEHARLRAFFEDLAHSPRAGAPVLLIGQKMLLEPDDDALISLSPLTAADIATLLSRARITLEPGQQQQLLTFTRGNPLLLRLFIALYEREKNLADILQQLTAPVALDWFMARLRLHLSPAEVAVLYELSVYVGAAPRCLAQQPEGSAHIG